MRPFGARESAPPHSDGHGRGPLTCKLEYDAATHKDAQLPSLNVWLVLGLVGLAFIVISGRNRRVGLAFAVVWVVGWALGATLLWRHGQSQEALREEARRPDAPVVSGIVEDFEPMPANGHGEESFRVGQERFSYSDFDATRPGFNHSSTMGGPIRGGIYVRIAHRDHRILRLEVCEYPEDGGPDGDGNVDGSHSQR